MNASKNALLRLLEGSFLIALFATSVAFAYTLPWGFCLFSLLVIALATGAAWELCILLKKKQMNVFSSLLLIGGGVYLLLHALAYRVPSFDSLPLLWLLVLLSALAWYSLKRKGDVIEQLPESDRTT